MEELNPRKRKLTEEQEANLKRLHAAINKVREAYGKPMIVTSGVRSKADQMRINPRAPNSNHVRGLAVDIRDRDGKLWEWCMENIEMIEDLGFYLEDKKATPTWIHFQLVPPRSGRRIFKP